MFFFREEYFSSVKENIFDLDQIFVYLEFVNVLYFFNLESSKNKVFSKQNKGHLGFRYVEVEYRIADSPMGTKDTVDTYLEPETSIYKWLFQLDDSKSLHRKRLFNQTSILNWLFGVRGSGINIVFQNLALVQESFSALVCAAVLPSNMRFI